MALTWTKSLAVGFGRIDDQHKELFSRYNDLIAACTAGKGKEEIISMLDFLAEYVTSHFAEEERYMMRYRYPEQVSHRQQHREMVATVEEVRRELREEGPTVAVITMINHTLLNWLIRHVKQTDVELARFLVLHAA